MTKIFAAAALGILLTACGKDAAAGEASGNDQAAPSDVAAFQIETPEVHHASCGCKLDSVGHCGNYVQLEGKWVELEWDGLGSMEWCAAPAGADIEIAGAMKDGKFVASSYKPVD